MEPGRMTGWPPSASPTKLRRQRVGGSLRCARVIRPRGATMQQRQTNPIVALAPGAVPLKLSTRASA